MSHKRMAFIVLLLLMVSNIGCSGGLPKQGAYKDYNVIIVLIDALRYDRLGCYGYKRHTSPNINALSKQSIVFKNAIAQATWTKPSVVSLFTSNYVEDHWVVNGTGIDLLSNNCPACWKGNELSPDFVTLTEVLKANGYRTKALIGNGMISKKFGLERGFDEYSPVDFSEVIIPKLKNAYARARCGDSYALRKETREAFDEYSQKHKVRKNPLAAYSNSDLRESSLQAFCQREGNENFDVAIVETSKPDPALTKSAIDWVNAHKDSKFFMYLHYMAPHADYDPPKRYRVEFKPEYHGNFFFPNKFHKDYFNVKLSQEETDELMARYDGEISFVDDWIGIFIKDLRRQNLLKKTILVILADHGEALGENGPIGHGYSFNIIAQVPLIFFPGEGHGEKVIDDLVGLVDVAPSICSLLGIKAPPSFKGKNFFDPCFQKKEYEFSEAAADIPGHLIRSKTHFFKYDLRTKEAHLYDLRSDPYELKDISNDHVGLVRKFISAYNTIREDQVQIPVGAYAKDNDSAKRLRALGYLQ